MLQYPDMMRRAQEELDSVVGAGRMPSFGDRDSLPFMEALMSELLRFSVPVPLGTSCYSMAFSFQVGGV